MSRLELFVWLVGYGLISACIGGIAHASTQQVSHVIEYVPNCINPAPERKRTKVAEL